MAQAQGFGRRYIKAFFKGFFVAVPVTVTFLDRVACVARVEGASMQPSLNPGGRQESDVVLLNHWSIRNYDVQRGDIVSLVCFSITPRIIFIILRGTDIETDRLVVASIFFLPLLENWDHVKIANVTKVQACCQGACDVVRCCT
ncbi:mitochondrial inner membrane protease subunit 2 isoform X4 [Anas acuta]|uniref:mitochondrial inner membrane protease subunit 2 isoform X3 n=1 Tax=Anas platyrhynchos TaxID=8839 RepID=UPI00065DE07C|eukprot:XP_012949034.1 mitochondrial inner membrane protease subunit 2 isoform X4 [Anas platyrhynchos]